ncbi:hypothetical protein FD755_001176, partial [Muntiacus reevesi]
CFIPNIYAALFTAALVPLMCLVVVFVVFIHAYQVKPQWKAYDDVFRGRTNAAGLLWELLPQVFFNSSKVLHMLSVVQSLSSIPSMKSLRIVSNTLCLIHN